ncbi:MAG: ABC transporter ATP-binding protein [Planctomycetes bacterium]|nr:ABC transporter ATP-binding protein [Planctomycetota bacterium]
MANIQLENLTKIFPPNIAAVTDLNLTVADGEFLVLLGPSGCGKTTTLRLIAGLETPTEGTISIDNTIVNDIPPQQRQVALLFQHYALYPHMNVYQNLAFPLKFTPAKLNKNQIDQKVQQTSKLLEINDLLQRKPRQLSGGQRQRVALGRAIIGQPKVFLLDEPLSNLDATLAHQTRRQLRQLHTKLAITTIYVTHDQDQALALADRIAIMNHGIIHQIDTPQELYHKPKDRFTAAFIGSPTMNLLPGTIRITNINHCQKTNNNNIIPDANIENDNKIIFDFTQKNTADSSEFQIILPKSLNNKLLPYRNNTMILGIRPEDVLLYQQFDSNIQSEHKDYVYMDVTAIESLGAFQNVYLRFGSTPTVVARCDNSVQLHNGQRVAVQMNLDRIHVFEPGEKGRNVTLKGMTSRAGE